MVLVRLKKFQVRWIKSFGFQHRLAGIFLETIGADILDTQGNLRIMDIHIKIGKSILDQYSKYAETEVIDDEAEYFPTVKVIIEGIVGTLESTEEKEEVESVLIDQVKQSYISLWIKNATEDEDNPDINYEKSRASIEFNRLYYD